jgi:hypothetical protein
VLAEQVFSGLLDDRQALGPVVNDVDRDLGNVSGAGAGGVEGAAEVGEDLAGLGGQVSGTDEVAVSVLGFLAGDEDHRGSGRDDDVGVGRGNGQAFGVDELECHKGIMTSLPVAWLFSMYR